MARVLVQERSPPFPDDQSAIRDDLVRRSEMMSHTFGTRRGPAASTATFGSASCTGATQALRHEGPDPTGDKQFVDHAGATVPVIVDRLTGECAKRKSSLLSLGV
jgi:hypothetical protein